MDPTTPTFNLKAVVQETGIKPDTLRAWERRYGLPEPNRSTGGHRLYSQRNIDTLRWLIARQEEGLSISRAVELWRQLENENQDPLLSAEYSLNESEVGAPSLAGEEVSAIREMWVAACMNFNERMADQLLAQAFALFPTETVCMEVLQKGIREIGEGWYAGRISVQQEHFASALVIRKLDSLLNATPAPLRSGRILLAGVAEEEHVIGQLIFQLLLRRKGWETVYLGAGVPLQRMEQSLDLVHPHLIVLTAQQIYTAAALQKMAENLAPTGIPIAYAGRAFVQSPTLRSRIRGYYLGDTMRQAVNRVETLIPAAPPLPDVLPISDEYRTNLAHFQGKATAIQARVMTILDWGDMQPSQIEQAGLNLTRSIHAALQLGDLELMHEEMEWIQGLLHNFAVPENALHQFLAGYRQAAHELLGAEGSLVLAWLDTAHAELEKRQAALP